MAVVDAIAEMDEHRGAAGVRSGSVATRLHLLGNDPGVALEFEAAVRRHAFAGNDEEGLALRRRHRLVTRNGGPK